MIKEVILTERDQAILISLFKNKVMTLKFIHNAFFKGRCTSASRRRMRKLASKGFVQKKSILINNASQIYYAATEKGVTRIKEHLNGRVESRNYKSNSICHDLTLSEISNVFEQFEKVKNIHSESELQSYFVSDIDESLVPFSSLRSDRVLEVKGAKRPILIALEYERTLKTGSRNVRKFRDFYMYSSLPAICYVCENQSLVKSLMEIDKRVCESEKPKVYFTTLSEVLKSSGSVTFMNFKKDKLVFK